MAEAKETSSVFERLGKLLSHRWFGMDDDQRREMRQTLREYLGDEACDVFEAIEETSATLSKQSDCLDRFPVFPTQKGFSEIDQFLQKHYATVTTDDLKARRAAFHKLLDEDPSEQAIHDFLAENAYLFCDTPVYDHRLIISKPRLSDRWILDFGLYGSCNGPWWTFVELERPSDRLFTKQGDYTQKLMHACRQVHDWQLYISKNFAQYYEAFGSDMFVAPHVNFIIVIGRRREIDKGAWERLSIFNEQGRGGTGVYIATFEFLLDNFERFIGNRHATQSLIRALSWPDFRSLRKLWESTTIDRIKEITA